MTWPPEKRISTSFVCGFQHQPAPPNLVVLFLSSHLCAYFPILNQIHWILALEDCIPAFILRLSLGNNHMLPLAYQPWTGCKSRSFPEWTGSLPYPFPAITRLLKLTGWSPQGRRWVTKAKNLQLWLLICFP